MQPFIAKNFWAQSKQPTNSFSFFLLWYEKLRSYRTIPLKVYKCPIKLILTIKKIWLPGAASYTKDVSRFNLRLEN